MCRLLGIETTGRVMSTIVGNTAILCRKSDTFTTEEDHQTEIDVVVFEGERASTDAQQRARCSPSRHRARQARRAAGRIFDIDANGILSVTAVDKVTGARGAVTITSTTARNSKDDVHGWSPTQKYAAADAKLKQKADARRALEDLIFDMLDDENPTASSKKTKAAEDAELWLQEEYDDLSPEDINAKYRQLRALCTA